MEDLKKIKWENLKSETADFILSESEKFLSGQIETSKLLTKRAETIMSLSLPILAVIIGFVVDFVSDIDTSIHDKGYFPLVVSVYSAISLLVILVLSVDVFWLYQIRPTGNDPGGIVRQWKIDSQNQYVAFVFWRIKSIQRMIHENRSAIETRINRLKTLYTAVKVSLIGALVMTLCYLAYAIS